MSNYDELIGILKELLFNRYLPQPQIIKGLLGDGTGVVRVPGRKDFNYARFNRGSSKSFEVFNKTVPEVDGWPILMSEFPWQPGLIQVVGTDWEAYIQSGWGDSVSTANPHAPTHVWRDGYIGSDPLNVYMRMIAPGRAYSPNSTGTVVYVNSFEYHTGTIWPGTPGIDLAPLMSSIPTGTARFAGVYVNPDNTLGVVTGATGVDTQAFDPPLVTFPFGVIPKARVRLYGGQAGLKEIDFRDARRIEYLPPTGTVGGGSPTGLAGGDLTGSYPDPRVAGLFGYSLVNTAPGEGNVLMFSGSAWRPVVPSASGAPINAQYYVAALDGTLTNEIVPGLDTFKVSKLVASDGAPDPAWSVGATGILVTNNERLDMNGKYIILDADADTSFGADVDGQVTWLIESGQLMIFNTTGIEMSSGKRLGIGRAPSVALDLEAPSGDAIIAAFRGQAAGSNINAEYEHLGSPDTGNQIILGFVLQTTSQRRTALNIVGSFSDTTDASRTSLAEFRVANNGGIAARLAIAGNNIGVNTTTQFGSGAGVIGIANASTNPTTNPSNGHVLYSDAGALKGRGSSGTTTTIAAADPHCPVCGRDAMLEWQNEGEGWHIQMCAFCLADEIGERPWIRKVVKDA